MLGFTELVGSLSSVWNVVLSIILTFFAGWFVKTIYDAKLRRPVKMYFLIPDKRHKLSYVGQDEKLEHLVKELVLPSNSESQVFIWFKPRVNYYEDMHYFCCDWEGDLAKKPRVIRYSNPFILENNLQISYYIDWHRYYHLRTGQNRVKNEVYVGGFIVKTLEEGEYKANVFVHTPRKLGSANLKISVSDDPSTEVLCLSYMEEKREIKKLFRKKHKKHNLKFGTY